ncbi:M56 family metallopeptidase [Nocardia crassostreae]|uniref:M56 family metallopeptidase n=1 Tax=Nocardia crassostreae TaxID=53428 RepID=UPI000832E247|nr:M56 family metallopeptidase [Nocardia crassostreae]
MSVAACLLFYGFAVAVLAPRLLRRVGQAGAAPRVALIAWLASMASTVLAWSAALVMLVVDLVSHGVSSAPKRILDTCLTHLHDATVGRYGTPVQVALLLLAGAVSLAAGVLAVRLATSLLRARRTTFEHAQLTRMAGRHHPDLDAVVLEVDEPAAYCVAGKPHTVVVSRAVLTALPDDHLDAVLSHERAHLSGRHHLLLAATRGLATVLPGLTLFTIGAREVARLLEMLADDAAARIHGRGTVLRALLTLSGMKAGPAGALGAAEVALATRVQRLSAPTAPASRTRARLTLTAAAATATLAPLASLLVAVGIALCTPIPG